MPEMPFHMDNHIYQGVSHLWKKFQNEIVHQRTFTKKAPNFFWLPVKDIKISYIFYKIQNFQGHPWASIIATCLIKLLRTGPLGQKLLPSRWYDNSKCFHIKSAHAPGSNMMPIWCRQNRLQSLRAFYGYLQWSFIKTTDCKRIHQIIWQKDSYTKNLYFASEVALISIAKKLFAFSILSLFFKV